jgi:hypothetical protein
VLTILKTKIMEMTGLFLRIRYQNELSERASSKVFLSRVDYQPSAPFGDPTKGTTFKERSH